MRYAHIVGWGKSAPERVVTNDEIAAFVDTSDTWIRERSGIGQRHMAGAKDSCASISIAAALEALDVANISPSQLGLIIVATSTPDYAFPSTACLVQDALGADSAGAFDLSAACSGFIYGLSMASDAIKAGSCEYALVIGADVMTRLVNWADRSTCVLFGDGAGAVVLQSSDQPGGVLSTILRADGSGGDMLYVRTNFRETPANVAGQDGAAAATAPAIEEAKGIAPGHMYMNGREVFRFGVRILAGATREIIARTGWEIDQIDLLIPHQANIRILESASKSLSLPMERFYHNIEHYGNTSAASIPIAICDAVTSGRLRPNHKVVMVGFGGGLTWASAAVEWGTPRALNRANRTMNRVRLGLANVRSRARRVLRRVEDRVFGSIELSPAAPPAPAMPAPNGKSAPLAEGEPETRRQ